jgi:hypothetical protein
MIVFEIHEKNVSLKSFLTIRRIIIKSKKKKGLNRKETVDYQPREWGMRSLSPYITRSRFGYEDFISPMQSRCEYDYRRKVRFLELGQYIQRFDILRHIEQWHRFMLARQNHESKNKFWITNYAAELDMKFYQDIQKFADSSSDLSIPVRATLRIEAEWEELEYKYFDEYEKPHIKIFEKLVRDDILTEFVCKNTERARYFDDIAMQECIQLGFKPEKVTKNMIDERTISIHSEVNCLELSPVSQGTLSYDHTDEDFVTLNEYENPTAETSLLNVFKTP